MIKPLGNVLNLRHVPIIMLWIGAVVDPIGGMFGIRYISIAIASIFIFFYAFSSPKAEIYSDHRKFLTIIFAIVLPIHGLVLYALNRTGDNFTDTSYLAAGLLMTFSYIYRCREDCVFGLKSFLIGTRLLSLLTIFTFFLYLFNLDSIIGFFTSRNVALVGSRVYNGVEFPYIYFVASPILIFLLSYDFAVLKDEYRLANIVRFLTSGSALFLSGTRAHIFIAVLFIPAYYFLRSNRNFAFNIFIFFNLIVLTALLSPDLREVLGSLLSSSETNNSAKIRLLSGYRQLFDDPMVILFGQGFNAHEWSNVFRTMVISLEFDATKTELTYLELFRVFGIFTATLFLFYLVRFINATKRLRIDFPWIYPGLVLYLANAALNPYLFSINGILPIGLFASILTYFKQTEKIETRSKFYSLIESRTLTGPH